MIILVILIVSALFSIFNVIQGFSGNLGAAGAGFGWIVAFLYFVDCIYTCYRQMKDEV